MPLSVFLINYVNYIREKEKKTHRKVIDREGEEEGTLQRLS